jgi:protein phosphatase
MQKLVEAGELTEEEAEHSERRNIILQALGPEPTIKVDLTHQKIRRGDTLVLCSDGLSGQVTKDDIAAAVVADTELTNVCRTLIDRANANGGPDNITVIVARFDGVGLQSAASEDAVGHRVFPLPETGQTPAVAMDRVVEAETPTQPVPIAQRPRPSRPATPAVEPDRSPSLVYPVEVSASRRSTGRLIAYALLAVLVAGAAWFVVTKLRGVAPVSSTSVPNR